MLEGYDAAINSVAFSPDGSVLASGNQDETIRLWDLGFRTAIGHLNSSIVQLAQQEKFSLDRLEFKPLTATAPDLYVSTVQAAAWSHHHPFHWLPRAEEGDGEAMIALGNLYLRDDDREQAGQWFLKAREIPATRSHAEERIALLRRMQVLH